MLSLPDDWNYSISGLVTLSKDGKDSVMSALGELEKFGYLTRKRLVNDKGQFNGIEYNIYEEPQKEIPNADSPILDIEHTEKPNAENREQLNTNSINNLFNELYKILNTNNGELVRLYEQYIMMRDNIKAPLTPVGLKKLVDRCRRLAKKDVRIEKILLETALINNWKNVYLPREEELQAVRNETIEDLRVLFGLDD
jgi:hypothetical protein